MVETNGLSAADVLALSNGNGNNGGMWNNPFVYLIWLAFFGGGIGGFGAREAGGANSYVTTGQFESANNFRTLDNKLNAVGDGICSATYDLNNSILSEGRAIQTQLADCCCTTQRAIDGVKYENALNTAAINANTTAGIQKILDKMCDDKTQAMAAKIQQLELQQALCGVVKYPNATTYNAGISPFYTGNNSCC